MAGLFLFSCVLKPPAVIRRGLLASVLEGHPVTQPLLLASNFASWAHDLAQTGIVALVVFGAIALIAVCRARPEDMVHMVEVIGRALASLVPWSRRGRSAGQSPAAETLPARPEQGGGLRSMEAGGGEGGADESSEA